MKSAQTATVLITGAGRRIGRALALDFGARGWRVGVHFNTSSEEADEVARLIAQAGGRAAAIGANLADAEAVAGLIEACGDQLGPVTCLINNASQFRRDTLDAMTDETWRAHIDVNLRAPLFLAQALARQLPAGQEGNIVNIVDQRVLATSPDFFSYSISKAALWTATRMLAQELAPHIRVNAIAPGPTLRSIHQSSAEFAAESASTLLGHGTSPDEIAAAVRFVLASPAMTGQIIALDGGQHLAFGHLSGDGKAD